MSLNLSRNLTWQDLYNGVKNIEDKKNIERLKNLLKINDIQFLLKQFSRLKRPEEIQKLTTFQERQYKLGAWVNGILPDQLVETGIIIPESFSSKIKCIIQLAEQKKENIDAIRALGEYNLSFKSQKFEIKTSDENYPDSWNLKIDLSVFRNTLDFIEEGKEDGKRAAEIANLEANQEMLKHRRNLGYLPEPITDTADLVQLLLWAASDKPLDLIWKWLNPMNIFELADIYNNYNEFNELYRTIRKNKEKLCTGILSEISKYIKRDLTFNETFSPTFGFAIRGWATDKMFGVNIENIKDDYNKLIATIAHELFHRLQTKICAGDDSSHTFSDIVSGNFQDEKDNKFYEVLSYIMLEGTGEFITHQFTNNKDNLLLKAREGLGLLEKIYDAIYIQEDMKKANDMLGQGLKSNGVFYSLGEYITDVLIKKNNESYLGEILQRGVKDFFIEGLESADSFKCKEEVLLKIEKMG